MLKRPFFGRCPTLGRIFGQKKTFSNLFIYLFLKYWAAFQYLYLQTKFIREIAQSVYNLPSVEKLTIWRKCW